MFNLAYVSLTEIVVEVKVCFFKPHVFVAPVVCGHHVSNATAFGLVFVKKTSCRSTQHISVVCEISDFVDLCQMMCYQCEQTNAGKGCTTTGAGPRHVTLDVLGGGYSNT